MMKKYKNYRRSYFPLINVMIKLCKCEDCVPLYIKLTRDINVSCKFCSVSILFVLHEGYTDVFIYLVTQSSHSPLLTFCNLLHQAELWLLIFFLIIFNATQYMAAWKAATCSRGCKKIFFSSQILSASPI